MLYNHTYSANVLQNDDIIYLSNYLLFVIVFICRGMCFFLYISKINYMIDIYENIIKEKEIEVKDLEKDLILS